MAKISKKSKNSASDKMLVLFQHRTFSIVFFLAVFGLLGGAFFLYKSNADAYVTYQVSSCVVSGNVKVNGFGSVAAYTRSGTRVGSASIAAPSYGRNYKFKISGVSSRQNVTIQAFNVLNGTNRLLGSASVGPC